MLTPLLTILAASATGLLANAEPLLSASAAQQLLHQGKTCVSITTTANTKSHVRLFDLFSSSPAVRSIAARPPRQSLLPEHAGLQRLARFLLEPTGSGSPAFLHRVAREHKGRGDCCRLADCWWRDLGAGRVRIRCAQWRVPTD